MFMREHFIYALICPISNNIRYIGQSVDVNSRYRRHIYDSRVGKKDHKSNWINYLLNLNLKPILQIIEVCNESNVDKLEIFYINKYREIYDLTNSHEGGRICVINDEIKNKIRNTLMGRKPSPNAAIAFAKIRSIKIECYKEDILIGTYDSMKECCEILSLNRAKVSMVLNKLRPHHKGYTFIAV